MNKVIKALKKNYSIYMFVLPLILIMLIFLVYPILKAAVMSVQYWYMSKPSENGHYFVGIENYISVFKNEYFYNSLKVTLIYLIVTVAIRFLLGFAAAIILNTGLKGRGIARSIVIVPWAVPEVVACLVWMLMYDKEFGIINFILKNIGLIENNIAYLQDTSVSLIAAIIVNIWKGFPFVAIMLLAGLQSIPAEMYEAATVDGASNFRKLRHITIPSLKPVSNVIFLLLIIWTIKDYAIVYVLAKGGPLRSTEILTIFVQQTAFKYFNFGEATATGMIMLVFSLIFTAIYFKMLNKDGGNQ